MLLKARRLVSDDKELIEFLLEGPDYSQSVWTTLAFRDLQLTGEIIREDLDDDLDLLVSLVQTRTAAARLASNAGEWELALARLGMCAKVVVVLMHQLNIDQDLAYSEFAAQFEEIAADCGGYFRAKRAGYGGGAQLNWAGASAIGLIGKAKGAEFFERILEERVPVPDALKEVYRKNGRIITADLPNIWLYPPAELQRIIFHIVLRSPRSIIECSAEAKAKLQESFGLFDLQEGVDLSTQLAESGENKRCVELLDALIDAYPCFALLRLERAIRLDEAGRTIEAWSDARSAILLGANFPDIWRSAGVILRRLNKMEDAVIAAAMVESMASAGARPSE